MTRRMAGATASCLALLGGLWLVLAPFALGTQPSGRDWTDETVTDVASGLGLAAVGLIGLVAFMMALRQHLVERGLVAPRHSQRRAAPSASDGDTGEAPRAASTESELSALLAPLVAALTRDVTRDRQAGNGAVGNAGSDRPHTEREEQPR